MFSFFLSSNFCQIGSLTGLGRKLALSELKHPNDFSWEIGVSLLARYFFFYQIIFKCAGNQDRLRDRHNI